MFPSRFPPRNRVWSELDVRCPALTWFAAHPFGTCTRGPGSCLRTWATSRCSAASCARGVQSDPQHARCIHGHRGLIPHLCHPARTRSGRCKDALGCPRSRVLPPGFRFRRRTRHGPVLGARSRSRRCSRFSRAQSCRDKRLQSSAPPGSLLHGEGGLTSPQQRSIPEMLHTERTF